MCFKWDNPEGSHQANGGKSTVFKVKFKMAWALLLKISHDSLASFVEKFKAHGACKFVSLTPESCYYFSLLLFKLFNCFIASSVVSPSIPISSEMSCFGDFKIPFPVTNPFYFMPFPPSWVFPSLSSAINAVAMLWCQFMWFPPRKCKCFLIKHHFP